MLDAGPKGYFDTAVKAMSAVTIGALGKALIQRWKATKKEEFEAHAAIIVELRKINEEQYLQIQQLHKEVLALTSQLIIAQFEAVKRGWDPATHNGPSKT